MLHVQKFLQTRNLDDLSIELGIKIVRHPVLPLIILNYNQLESPKINPVVRECRGLVLHADTKELIAKSFSRFFNWGEVVEEQDDFDFSDFTVQEKLDGSLCIIYHFEGTWHANTRGSFALDTLQFQDFTWREAFCKAMKAPSLDSLSELNKDITYICEFCSPWNKIVRQYNEPEMYLLTAFRGVNELSPEETDDLTSRFFKRPLRYSFKSIEEIQAFLKEQEEKNPTFEGVVIRDRNGNRWKLKNSIYVALHKLRGEGDNLWNPKHLLPFIMAGEDAELLVYFPEVRSAFFELKSKVQEYYTKTLEVWADNKDIPVQKDFALAVKDTPFASVLFSVRKKSGLSQKSAQLREEWRNNEALILKRLLA